MPTKRINLWSSPRNISTALMYSFAQRPDTHVVDEPLYAHYLSHGTTTLNHPATDEILETQSRNGRQVVKNVLLAEYDAPVVVFKQMTHHLVGLDRSFLKEMKNVLLIRDPRRIIASFVKVIPNPRMEDVGIQMQYELYQQLHADDQEVIVLDTKELLLNPNKILIELCQRLDIPFTEAMLSWNAGPRPEDGVWAPYWYGNVHQSTGFQAYQDKEVNLPENLEILARRCEVFYNYLQNLAIGVEGRN